MTSVERTLEYCNLEPETQPEKPQEVTKYWPSEGGIEFRNVIYRYFRGAEPVLRDVSFVVKPKEKIGKIFTLELANYCLSCGFSFENRRCWSNRRGKVFIDRCYFTFSMH